MNKYLVDFFEDELKNNNYYDGIRDFAAIKKLDFTDILRDIVNDYDKNGDYFNPYKYMDAIEDFIDDNYFDITEYDELYEVIDDMWDRDSFENY